VVDEYPICGLIRYLGAAMTDDHSFFGAIINLDTVGTMEVMIVLYSKVA